MLTIINKIKFMIAKIDVRIILILLIGLREFNIVVHVSFIKDIWNA